MTLQIMPTSVLIALALTACAPSSDSPGTVQPQLASAPTSSAPSGSPAAATMASDLLLVTVYKSASCGCCSSWVDHMRKNGFRVDARNVDDLGSIKERVGVPVSMRTCHTAEVGGYFVEGHVPAADVKRLLAERPNAKGLAVPGMPAGSPGMETPSGKVQPYDVLLVANDGSTSVFAHHRD